MSQLKTLKEILDKEGIDFETGNWGEPLVDLRLEAINWIKSLRNDSVILSNGIPETVEGSEIYNLNATTIKPIIFWIKNFFNISEDELK